LAYGDLGVTRTALTDASAAVPGFVTSRLAMPVYSRWKRIVKYIYLRRLDQSSYAVDSPSSAVRLWQIRYCGLFEWPVRFALFKTRAEKCY
jgi:hypothetical protein